MDSGEPWQRGGGGRQWDNRGGDRGYQGGDRGYQGGPGGPGRGSRQYYNDPGYQPRGPPPPRGGYQGGGGGGWQQPGPPRGGAPYYNNFEQGGGYYQQQGGGGGGRGRGRGRYQSWGRGAPRNNTWERGSRPREEEENISVLPQDVAHLAELPGHTKKVTCIAYEPTSQQLYTGSMDGTVRTWSTTTGQCVSCVEVGGEVDSLLLGGGYLFVGMHKGGEGIIKVWNMATGANHLLTGHKGQVLSLAIASSALVSGGQDNTIRVWNFNQQAQIFMSQAIISQEDGGHYTSVHALCVMGNVMFSADRAGNIVAWDLASGKAVQRLDGAHGDQPIMSLLAFENCLLSAGFDGLIKAWQLNDQPLPGAVVKPQPEFVFDKDNPEGGGDQGAAQQQQGGGGFGGRQRRGRGSQALGIVSMSGTTDMAGVPILMVAYNGEACVRLYQLPDFGSRGVLTPVEEARSLGSVAGTVMLTGDMKGVVRVFQWKATAALPGATPMPALTG